ncbi:DUF6712 family protein [Tellurirhabdus rosea]|uniref:DUF6712 family protein n=1 Tax=Tellurirhabdus rosea TaxID=2674997 RepID=UPI0022576781|nr:DUF6712 family protein [Tellurirhabdus rosea]
MVTIEILKAHLGGVQMSLKMETVQPFVDTAERWFRKRIGRELYQYLQAVTTPDAAELEMISLAQACISWYAYSLAFPHLKVRVGNAGMSKQVPQDSAAVTKWEYVDSIEAIQTMLNRQYEDFWMLVDELMPEAWTASAAYQARQALLLRSATEILKFVTVENLGVMLYEQLMPYIARAEEFYLRPLVTEDDYDHLKAGWKAPTAVLSTQEQRLVELLQPALAHLAIFEAYPYLRLSISSRGISEKRSKDGLMEEVSPSIDAINTQHRQLFIDGQLYLNRAKEYLDRTASNVAFIGYRAAHPIGSSDDDNADYSNTPHILL